MHACVFVVFCWLAPDETHPFLPLHSLYADFPCQKKCVTCCQTPPWSWPWRAVDDYTVVSVKNKWTKNEKKHMLVQCQRPDTNFPSVFRREKVDARKTETCWRSRVTNAMRAPTALLLAHHVRDDVTFVPRSLGDTPCVSMVRVVCTSSGDRRREKVVSASTVRPRLRSDHAPEGLSAVSWM